MHAPRKWWAWVLSLGVLLFLGAFLIYPVSFTLRRAFGLEGEWTLRHFGTLLESPLQREALANSLILAFATTIATTLISLPIAHWMTRYRFAGKGWLNGLLLVPMIMPPFVGAIGLKQLLGKFGSLNLGLVKLGLLAPDHPIDWLGHGGFVGMVVLQSLSLYPIMFLNLSASLANVDPSLREAAQNLGATPWRLFRTITLPLILPGYFAGATIVFIWAFTDLGTPLMLGYARVVPVQIFDALSELNTNPSGYALVVTVLMLCGGLFLLSKHFVGSRRYDSLARGQVTGAESQAGWRQTGFIWICAGGLILISLLPHVMVVVQALADRWFFTVLPQSYTSANFSEVLGHGLTASSIKNSLLYSGLSSLADLILGVIIAWLITRACLPISPLIDMLATLPLALPGLVLAFGYVAGFDSKYGWLNPRVNPTLLLIVSYTVRRLPFIVRSAVAGFQQTSVTLEEASGNLGASPFRTLRKITLPLVAANLIAGTLLTFSFAMLEVSDGLILAMREQFFPMTKMIWQLIGRMEPNAPSVACALGVLGMILLMISLLVAGRILGKRMGQLFKA